MNDFERFIDSDWGRIIYPVGKGRYHIIPSPLLLRELILFPENKPDPFNVDRYRIRPQAFDLDSLSCLKERSNRIVNRLFTLMLNRGNLLEEEFCLKNNISYMNYRYARDITLYLDGLFATAYINVNSKLVSQIAASWAQIKSKKITHPDIDAYLQANYPDVYRFIKRQESISRSYTRRFNDYTLAHGYLTVMHNEASFSRDENQIVELFADGFNEFNKGRISLLKEIKKANSIVANVDKIKSEIVRNDERSFEAKNVLLLPKISRAFPALSKTDIGIKVTINTLINEVQIKYCPILLQCLFCHRFSEIEACRVVPKSCDRPECKRQEKKWRASLDRREISLVNVSPSGF
jgi:hypothetical protein